MKSAADSPGTAVSGDVRLIDIPGMWWKLALGWLLYGVNSWSAHVMWFVSTSRKTPWLRLGSYELLRSLSWIALTWAIFAFVDRQPAMSMPFRTAFFKVAPLVLLAGLADLAAGSAAEALTDPWAPMTFADSFEHRLTMYFHDSLMWIFIIVGIGHGVRFHYARAESRLRESQVQTALAQARLQTLSSRMQPHFLFNALNSIAALVRSDSRAAESMISRLGDLLRAAMNGGDEDMIPVAEELKFAQQYLAIQQIRYADRLSIEISSEPAARNVRVPRFILQPLVENAVKHGIEPLETPGKVSVHASVCSGRLILAVCNDAPPGELPPDSKEGLGLAHTRARLALLFGDGCRFRIIGNHHTITAVVEIPAETESRSSAG